MIWILLGYLLFGTGGERPVMDAVDAMRARAAAVVQDPARRARIEVVTGEFVTDLEAAVERFQAQEERFLEALRRKDSTRDELRAHILVTREIRRGVQLEMLDLRDHMHALLDESEWQQIFANDPPAQRD